MQRNLLTAAVLLGLGGGAFIYTWATRISTAEQRHLDTEEGKRLFKFATNDVKGGELFSRNATFTFERSDLLKWRITAPIDWPADAEAIDALLQRVNSVKITHNVSDDASDKDRHDTGLDHPRATVVIDAKEKHTLHVGTKNPLNGGYPITDATKKRIGVSDPSFYWALDRPLIEFRTKRLFFKSKDAVTSVTLRGRDGQVRYQLTRDDKGFGLTGPGVSPGARGDNKEILALLSSLEKLLLAERFVTDTYTEADAATYGFDQPLATFEVATGDSSVSFVVAKPSETTVMIHRVGSKTVAELDERFEAELARSAGDYQDRTLSRYAVKDVARIDMSLGQKKVSLRREGKDWRFKEERKGKIAKVWKIDRIIEVFSLMRASGRIKAKTSAAQLREYLLEPPSRRLTMFDADNKILADVRIGKYRAAGELFAQRGEDPTVFVLPDNRLKVLPTGVSDLEMDAP